MKINLTKKQYESLAKAVYLGDWVANAIRTGLPEDPSMKEYAEIYDYILSLAPQFDLPKDFELDLEFTDDPKGVTEVHKLIDEYEDDTFWEELPSRLGERDFYRKYSKKEVGDMNDEERFTKLMELCIEWENEFEKEGIERLGIVKK
jgi:hypothetical protein